MLVLCAYLINVLTLMTIQECVGKGLGLGLIVGVGVCVYKMGVG